jgi:phosphoglycerate dehydrogenase-like enzyme
MAASERVLIAHAGADAWLDCLRARFPDLPVAVARDPAGLAAALREGAPTVAYSCKTDDFPGPAHRPLLDVPGLRWLQVGGSGYDHLEGWRGGGIVLTNAAGVLAPALAEATVGAMVALAFGLKRYVRQQEAREWRKGTWRPLAGRTLLVVGVGAIGREVALRAKALGMRVVGLVRRPRELPGLDEVRPLTGLREALAEVDVVSLHLRLTPETAGLFGRATLEAMRPGALFLNSARGGLVDEAALADLLRAGRIAGAWLDVAETEPLPPASPLWGLDNLLLTPHCADRVEGWEKRLADFFMDNLERHLAGRPLLNRVA